MENLILKDQMGIKEQKFWGFALGSKLYNFLMRCFQTGNILSSLAALFSLWEVPGGGKSIAAEHPKDMFCLGKVI